MKEWQKVLFSFILGLLAAGVIYLVAVPPKGTPLVLNPPPTACPIKIHISGEVLSPGLYDLPQNSRVLDAVELAGGLSSEADENAVNLAEKVYDGEKIIIPSIKEFSQNTSEINPTQPLSTVGEEVTSELIDINHATNDQLQQLPGIGPALANEIINYRTANGPFYKIEDITKVSGIGPKTFEKFKSMITTGN